MDISRDSLPIPRSSSEHPWLRLVTPLYGWFAAPPVVATQPVGHSRAHKVARRSAKADDARRVAAAAQRWADSMADHPLKQQAEKLADVKYELAEAWFWLAGGDAVAAWERRCKAAEIRRGMQS
jgi:hypothetical protein